MDWHTLLAELLEQRRPLGEVIKALERLAPAQDEDLVPLTRGNLRAAIERVEAGDQSFSELVAWAAQVEMILEVGREEGHEPTVNTVLVEMATPDLDDRTTAVRLAAWLRMLASSAAGDASP